MGFRVTLTPISPRDRDLLAKFVSDELPSNLGSGLGFESGVFEHSSGLGFRKLGLPHMNPNKKLVRRFGRCLDFGNNRPKAPKPSLNFSYQALNPNSLEPLSL